MTYRGVEDIKFKQSIRAIRLKNKSFNMNMEQVNEKNYTCITKQDSYFGNEMQLISQPPCAETRQLPKRTSLCSVEPGLLITLLCKVYLKTRLIVDAVWLQLLGPTDELYQ